MKLRFNKTKLHYSISFFEILSQSNLVKKKPALHVLTGHTV